MPHIEIHSALKELPIIHYIENNALREVQTIPCIERRSALGELPTMYVIEKHSSLRELLILTCAHIQMRSGLGVLLTTWTIHHI